jgi:hypothetical protein
MHNQRAVKHHHLPILTIRPRSRNDEFAKSPLDLNLAEKGVEKGLLVSYNALHLLTFVSHTF